MDSPTTRAFASLDSLAAQKERELHEVHAARVSQLTALLSERTQALEAERKRSAALREDFTYNLKLIEQRDAELDALEDRLRESQQALAGSETERSDLASRLDDAETQLRTARETIATQRAEHSDTLRAMEAKHTADLRAAESRHAQRRREEAETLTQAGAEESRRLSREVDTLEGKLAAAVAEAEDLRLELETVHSRHASVESELADARRRAAENESHGKGLRRELEAVRQQSAREVAAARDEADTARREAAESQRELETRVAELLEHMRRAEAGHSERLESTARELDARDSEFRAGITRFAEQVSRETTRADAAERALTIAKEEIASLRHESEAAARRTRGDAEEAIRAAGERVRAAEAREREVSEQLWRKEAEVASLRTKADALAADLASRGHDLAAARDEIETLRHSEAEHKKHLVESGLRWEAEIERTQKAVREEVRSVVAQARDARDQAVERARSAETRAERLEKEFRAAEERANVVTARAREWEDRHKACRARVEELEARLVDVTASAKNASGNYSGSGGLRVELPAERDGHGMGNGHNHGMPREPPSTHHLGLHDLMRTHSTLDPYSPLKMPSPLSSPDFTPRDTMGNGNGNGNTNGNTNGNGGGVFGLGSASAQSALVHAAGLRTPRGVGGAGESQLPGATNASSLEAENRVLQRRILDLEDQNARVRGVVAAMRREMEELHAGVVGGGGASSGSSTLSTPRPTTATGDGNGNRNTNGYGNGNNNANGGAMSDVDRVALSSQVRHLLEHNRILQAQLEASGAGKEDHRGQEVVYLRGQIRSLNETIERLRVEIKSQRDESQRAREAAQHLSHDIEHLRSNTDRAAHDLSQMRSRCSTLESEVSRRDARVRELESALAALERGAVVSGSGVGNGGVVTSSSIGAEFSAGTVGALFSASKAGTIGRTDPARRYREENERLQRRIRELEAHCADRDEIESQLRRAKADLTAVTRDRDRLIENANALRAEISHLRSSGRDASDPFGPAATQSWAETPVRGPRVNRDPSPVRRSLDAITTTARGRPGTGYQHLHSQLVGINDNHHHQHSGAPGSSPVLGSGSAPPQRSMSASASHGIVRRHSSATGDARLDESFHRLEAAKERLGISGRAHERVARPMAASQSERETLSQSQTKARLRAQQRREMAARRRGARNYNLRDSDDEEQGGR